MCSLRSQISRSLKLDNRVERQQQWEQWEQQQRQQRQQDGGEEESTDPTAADDGEAPMAAGRSAAYAAPPVADPTPPPASLSPSAPPTVYSTTVPSPSLPADFEPYVPYGGKAARPPTPPARIS